MSKKRVVVTGYGTVNPVGNTVDEYWKALVQGRSGIQTVTQFDVSQYTTKIAGIIKNLDTSNCFDKKELRRTSKFIIYGTVAAYEAIQRSGLDIEKEAEQIGVEVGSGIGGIEILEQMAITLHERGPAKVSPFTVPMMIPDMAAGQIAIKTGAKGPNSCSVTACASAAHSMGNALALIRSGKAVAMITGGAEGALSPLGLASFCAARSLSTFNEEPEKASRPFDLNRDGFVMGEGAGILVFEELEHAKKRGANILAEVVGFGSSGDAYHITAPAPEGEGAKRAILAALEDGKLAKEDVGYINAHGTSTQLNDKNETAAMKNAFSSHAKALKISSTKSMTGHLLGAAGAIEAIACTKVIEESIIPPTINLETPDPNCDLDYTANNAVEKEISVALTSSFGFGGHNAVLAFKRYS